MWSLEKHRRLVVRETNANLGILFDKADVKAIHDFRVGVKRLRALYSFVSGVQPEMDAKSILKPYRSVFKSLGPVREGQIALELLTLLPVSGSVDKTVVTRTVRMQVRREMHQFRSMMRQHNHRLPRLPGIDSLGVSENSVIRYRKRFLGRLLEDICDTGGWISAEAWHRKRTQLKRYRYIMEAFRFTPGCVPDEEILKQLKMVDELLGDWHDCVATKTYLLELQGVRRQVNPLLEPLDKRRKALLSSARIYIADFAVRNGISNPG